MHTQKNICTNLEYVSGVELNESCICIAHRGVSKQCSSNGFSKKAESPNQSLRTLTLILVNSGSQTTDILSS